MNKQKLFGITSLLIIFSISLISAATCYVNEHGSSKEVPCPAWAGPAMWIGIIIAIAFFIFWLWMFIDAIRFEKEQKVLWILLILFISITSIIYYFVRKRKRQV